MPNTIIRWMIILVTLSLASCGGRHPTGKGDDRPPADGPGVVPTPPLSKVPPAEGSTPVKPPVDVVQSDLQLLARLERAKVCATARSRHQFSLQTRQESGGTIADPDFVAIKETLQSACSSCHGAPNANLGGFTFLGAYAGDTLSAHGTVAKYPGIAEVAAQVQDSVASGRMPPKALRSANPAAFDLLSTQLSRWIAAQKPERRLVAVDQSKTVLGLTEARMLRRTNFLPPPRPCRMIYALPTLSLLMPQNSVASVPSLTMLSTRCGLIIPLRAA